MTDERIKKTAEGGKFLTFYLSKEEYGLEILKVHEIIGMMTITPIPKAPSFIKGVINLRGKIIPLVDLRLKFGMEETKYSEQTCTIVVKVNGIEMGIIVDRVSEVRDISIRDIDETPKFGTSINTDYILGIGKTSGKVTMLLDIDQVLTSSELSEVKTVSNNKPVRAA